MGGAYAFVSTASANLREKNDPWNHFWGGLTGGALLGLRSEQYIQDLICPSTDQDLQDEPSLQYSAMV
jgi:hypothetical protein